MKPEDNPIWKSIKRKYRYKDIYKDKLWSAVSLFVVARDTKLYGGKCIACYQVKKLQAGHYAPMANCGLELAFDEDNIHGECEYDNGFNEGHLIGYKTGLIRRYSEPYAMKLEERYNDARYKGKTFKMSKLEYINKAIDFVKRTEKLLTVAEENHSDII